MSKPINQKRGPTTGNVATGSKRADFIKEKSTTNSERATIANMITGALEMRGRGASAKNKVDPSLEGLHEKTGKAANPTANGSRLPAKYKK